LWAPRRSRMGRFGVEPGQFSVSCRWVQYCTYGVGFAGVWWTRAKDAKESRLEGVVVVWGRKGKGCVRQGGCCSRLGPDSQPVPVPSTALSNRQTSRPSFGGWVLPLWRLHQRRLGAHTAARGLDPGKWHPAAKHPPAIPFPAGNPVSAAPDRSRVSCLWSRRAIANDLSLTAPPLAVC